jgi:hypothetical protein
VQLFGFANFLQIFFSKRKFGRFEVGGRLFF